MFNAEVVTRSLEEKNVAAASAPLRRRAGRGPRQLGAVEAPASPRRRERGTLSDCAHSACLLAAYRLRNVPQVWGSDWPDPAGPMAKVKEETEEVARVGGRGEGRRSRMRIGDLLFAVVTSPANQRRTERGAGGAPTRSSRAASRVEALAEERGFRSGGEPRGARQALG